MTQEERQILLVDLCARLPYHTIVKYRNADIDLTQYASSVKLVECVPYLRPMSSMTEEEREKLCEICTLYTNDGDASTYEYWGIEIVHSSRYGILFENNYSAIDWLNEHHFDYRGLIEMGLALEAHEDMYK